MYAIINVLVYACMPWARALQRTLDTKQGELDTEHSTDTHVECLLGSTPSTSQLGITPQSQFGFLPRSSKVFRSSEARLQNPTPKKNKTKIKNIKKCYDYKNAKF